MLRSLLVPKHCLALAATCLLVGCYKPAPYLGGNPDAARAKAEWASHNPVGPETGFLTQDEIARQHYDQQIAAQRAADAQRIETERQERIAAAEANPSPNLRAYEQTFDPAFRMTGLAMAANMCGFRSGAWAETLQQALAQMVKPASVWGLSGADGEAADAHAKEMTRQGTQMYSCTQLVNSPTMDELDAVQYRATGGYH